MRPIESRTMSRWPRIVLRIVRATSLVCSSQRSGSGSGTGCSPITRSKTRSRSPSLEPTCQYSAAAVVFSVRATWRMLSSSRPSASSTCSAASTIASCVLDAGDRAPCMRKIKSHFFMSLDGVVESPDTWHFPYFNDEMGAAVGSAFAGADAVLMGRVLYDEWAAYWPQNADQPFGDVINDIQKYVVSSSLQEAEWKNTEVVSGDAAAALRDLKARDGGDIAMSGSATTV